MDDNTRIVPVSAVRASSPRGERSIGAILIDARRLKPEDAERILRLQREQGLRFGDAALRLRLLSQADIDFAIARQFDYHYLIRGKSDISEDLVAAYSPFTTQVEALRALRGQLILRWFDGDPTRKALAIVSAARNEGRSFIAANLAVVFSQLGEHTLLIDADMRHPHQQELFALENRVGLSAVLSGRAGADAIHRIPSLLDLSVLPAGPQPPNPLELLARPPFPQLLADLAKVYDVIILDSPPAANYADAQTITVRAGAALIIVRKNATRMWQVRGVSNSATQASATVVGTVLNDF
ncbi:MAG: chain length determinant protein tyrosine kinase EpsG [Gammaproteobacteria bacterium]